MKILTNIIRVSPENIAGGVASDRNYCPIALAIRAHGWHFAHVATRSVACSHGGERRWWHGDLSNAAVEFVYRFDNSLGEDVAPFEFELTLTEDE
jgi:hypothetical protein